MAKNSLEDHGLPTVETSRSYSDTPQAVRLLWTSDQLDEVIST